MRKQYVDDWLYDNYYSGQVGSGSAAFAGARCQRGHGLGGMFRGLFRAATQLLKRGAMALGKQIISSGGEVAKDVAAGKKFKQALRHRLNPLELRAAVYLVYIVYSFDLAMGLAWAWPWALDLHC